MDNEDKQELLEIVDKVLNELLIIEQKSLQFSQDQFENIFRYLHNIKGTLAMLGYPDDVVTLVHRNENLLAEGADKNTISQTTFSILYTSMTQLASYLISGQLPKDFQQIVKCEKCKSAPEIFMPEECKSNFKENFINTVSELHIEESGYKKDESAAEILVISTNVKNCPLCSELKANGRPYHTMACVKDLARLGKDILKYKVIIIDVDHSTAPFFLTLRILNTVHKKCFIIACGEKKNTDHSNDFSDICYFWIGKKTSNFMKIIEGTLENYLSLEKLEST